MKIGFLLQQSPELRKPPLDGPAIHTCEVFRELRGLGHEVRLVVRLDGRIWMTDDLVTFRPVVVPAMDSGPLRLMERAIRRLQRELRLPYANLFESVRFALACRQACDGVELLYERFSWMGLGGGLAARLLGRPLIAEYNGDPLHDLEAKGMAPRGLQLTLALAMMRLAVGRMDLVVASGQGWRDQFIQRWNYDPNRITTIENGTSLVRLLRREDLRAYQPRTGQAADLRLVYLGGFLPWHGVEVLLRAFRSVRQQGVPARLSLVGSGPGREEIERQIAASDLQADVELTGALLPEAFGPLLAQSDIGLSPYCGWTEFSGLKLFDYKAAGLAIIASGEGGRPETLRHGRTAWIVPPCDSEALAQAILHLARDESLRTSLGRAARVEAEQRHGWDSTARQLEWVFTRARGNLGHVTASIA
ncbi:MAG TPA: glycosyltransferase family 4 protein [Anaerolineales bacterium]|nr:glycosyltransferase family 4 protein [Anaerolineales bacterium]